MKAILQLHSTPPAIQLVFYGDCNTDCIVTLSNDNETAIELLPFLQDKYGHLLLNAIGQELEFPKVLIQRMLDATCQKLPNCITVVDADTREVLNGGSSYIKHSACYRDEQEDYALQQHIQRVLQRDQQERTV